MKQIKLIRLRLLNFKGIRELTIEPSHITDIYGNNGTGKTTIVDAFLWLLFGKDSTERKDFEIKTLDTNNNVYHKMSHEVEALLEIDGDQVNIRRTYKENWPTQRGEAVAMFTGHTTNFFWNDVPMQLKEYQAKIEGIMQEQVFKLITNTGYFANLKWEDKRSVLQAMAGTIDPLAIAQDLENKSVGLEQGRFNKLIEALTAKKSVKEFQTQIQAQITRIKKEREELPGRIDEAQRSLPLFVDYDQVQLLLDNANGALQETDDLLLDQQKQLENINTQITDKMYDQQHCKTGMLTIEHQEKNKIQQNKLSRETAINNIKADLQRKQEELTRLNRDIAATQQRKETIQRTKNELTAKWTTENAKQLEFKPGEFSCPTCKREYDATNVEAKKTEMTGNFNQTKSRNLEEITNSGHKAASDIKELENELATQEQSKIGLENTITTLQQQIQTAMEENTRLSADDQQAYEAAIRDHVEYNNLANQATELAEVILELQQQTKTNDNSSILQKKRDLLTAINGYRDQLATKQQRTKIEARITELENQQRTLSEELADLDGVDFSIDQVNKACMNELEARINGKFQTVRFKMFEQQINGGYKDTCIALINGVPYSDANTASKINAGLDIIHALSEHYQVQAPIFIDNRESVFKILETDAQIISLIASEADLTLRVVNN